MHTMNLMVEEERRNVDSLRQEQVTASGAAKSAKLEQELDQAVKRLAKLENQLEGLKLGKVRQLKRRFYSLRVFTVSTICSVVIVHFVLNFCAQD